MIPFSLEESRNVCWWIILFLVGFEQRNLKHFRDLYQYILPVQLHVTVSCLKYDSCSASSEVPCLKVHYRVYSSSKVASILSQIKLTHIIPPYSFKTHFNSISQLYLSLPRGPFRLGFPGQDFVWEDDIKKIC